MGALLVAALFGLLCAIPTGAHADGQDLPGAYGASSSRSGEVQLTPDHGVPGTPVLVVREGSDGDCLQVVTSYVVLVGGAYILGGEVGSPCSTVEVVIIVPYSRQPGPVSIEVCMGGCAGAQFTVEPFEGPNVLRGNVYIVARDFEYYTLPVEGARVLASGAADETVFTDFNGDFAVSVPDGASSLQVLHPDLYIPIVRSFYVTEDRSGILFEAYEAFVNEDILEACNAVDPMFYPSVYSSGAPNLVFIAHGWNSGATSWPMRMGEEIVTTLYERTRPGFSTPGAWLAQWEVVSLNWDRYAGNLDEVVNFPPVGKVSDRARCLGKRTAISGYGHVHFIAHSAGSEFVQSVKPLGNPTIQRTFLDAFSKDGTNIFGTASTWADHYYTAPVFDFPQIKTPATQSFNVDMTDYWGSIRTICSPILTNIMNNPILKVFCSTLAHGSPIDWYESTVREPLDFHSFGFARTKEWLGTIDTPLVSHGADLCYPAPSCGKGLGISLKRNGEHKPLDTNSALSATFYTALSFATSTVTGPTGTVSTILAGLRMITGSPVSATKTTTTIGPTNVLRFEYAFQSAPLDTLFQVYVDGELVLSRTRDEMGQQGEVDGILLGDSLESALPAGQHTVQFWMDSSGGQATVDITNVAFGLRDVANERTDDANCDGGVNASDGLYLLRLLAGLDVPSGFCNPDSDGDGVIAIGDAVKVRREVAGIGVLPPGWTLTGGTLSANRFNFRAVTLDDGRVVAFGGVVSDQQSNLVDIYSPATNTWFPGPAMKATRANLTATKLSDGRILLVNNSTSEIYNPATNSFSFVGNPGFHRDRHAAVLLDNGKVLVAGGYQGCMKTQAELFNPATNTWAPTGTMAKARGDFLMVKMLDGRVLAMGGDDDCASPRKTARAEIYNPATGTWTEAAPMHNSRAHFAAVRMSDGRVFVAGGDNDSLLLKAAEVYNPATNQWTQVPAMANARFHPLGDGAFLLPSGKVMIAAGDSSPGGTREVYSPVTNSWSAPEPLNEDRCGVATAQLLDGRPMVI